MIVSGLASVSYALLKQRITVRRAPPVLPSTRIDDGAVSYPPWLNPDAAGHWIDLDLRP